jgi:heme/copper-type cytochrome/quinol oxidase subunit 4
LTALSVLRTFHFQLFFIKDKSSENDYTVKPTPSTSQVTQGEILNYILPFCFSVFFTALMYTLTLLTYCFRKWKFGFRVLSLCVQLLPAFFIPVLWGFLNTLNCFSHNLLEGEMNVPYCFDLSHVGFAIASMLLVIPFLAISFFFVAGYVHEYLLTCV